MEENIIMGDNMVVITDSKTFCFNFNLPKDVDEHLKLEIKFVIKSNESLAKIIIKTRLNNYC